jgi:hypothetical protein
MKHERNMIYMQIRAVDLNIRQLLLDFPVFLYTDFYKYDSFSKLKYFVGTWLPLISVYIHVRWFHEQSQCSFTPVNLGVFVIKS